MADQNIDSRYQFGRCAEVHIKDFDLPFVYTAFGFILNCNVSSLNYQQGGEQPSY